MEYDISWLCLGCGLGKRKESYNKGAEVAENEACSLRPLRLCGETSIQTSYATHGDLPLALVDVLRLSSSRIDQPFCLAFRRQPLIHFRLQ